MLGEYTLNIVRNNLWVSLKKGIPIRLQDLFQEGPAFDIKLAENLVYFKCKSGECLS